MLYNLEHISYCSSSLASFFSRYPLLSYARPGMLSMSIHYVCWQPVPTLEASMARYLERALPLLASLEAQEATKAKVGV
jgi:hypothetical protein